jgi:hypothetical protein
VEGWDGFFVYVLQGCRALRKWAPRWAWDGVRGGPCGKRPDIRNHLIFKYEYGLLRHILQLFDVVLGRADALWNATILADQADFGASNPVFPPLRRGQAPCGRSIFLEGWGGGEK